MSKYMLSDENTINDINPFVVSDFSLPGGWSEPQPYIDDTIDSKVYIASEGIVAGDRTIDSVAAIQPNCPMSRPLEPVRDNDYDIVIPRPKDNQSSSLIENVKEFSNNNTYILLAILLVVCLLLVNEK
jgi:hypothetical protein